jgi:predicted transcriptional regulator
MYLLSSLERGRVMDNLNNVVQGSPELANLDNRLHVLRELDSVIDFARGLLQLRIVLCLGLKGSLATRDIALILGERYKSVADAIRKLVVKGIVVKESDGGLDLYRLSDTGLEFYRKLQSVLGDGGRRILRSERRELIHDIASEMTRYVHLMDALIAVATSRNGELSLADIADAMKLSIDRARTYIEMFSDKRSGVKLFKKVEKESRILKTLSRVLKIFGINMKYTLIAYSVTEEGLSVFYRQPYYLKYKKSLACKIVTKLFGSAHPRLVLKRMSLILLLVTVVIALIAIAIPTSTTAALLTSFAIASSLLYIGYKAV